MVAFDYARARSTADRLITRYGAPATLRHVEAGTGGNPWDPASQTGGGAEDTDITAVVVDYTDSKRSNSLINATDRRALIAAGGIERAPSVGDEIVIGGKGYAILALTTLSPAGTVVLYDARVAG